MNERIQELGEQAMELVDPYAVEGEFGPKRLNVEKFAEMIVLECIGIVENLSPGYADYRNQIEDAFRRDCVEKVKEHFGVES
jgi:hypothetical protein